MGVIHDMNINNCPYIVPEATNVIHNNEYGSNLALKIDITKAFDTL